MTDRPISAAEDPWHEKTRCPHAWIEYCPLYVASHDGKLCGLGCVVDLAAPCRVEKGEIYATLLGLVMAADPRMVAEVKWAEAARASLEQRERNRRAAGIQ